MIASRLSLGSQLPMQSTRVCGPATAPTMVSYWEANTSGGVLKPTSLVPSSIVTSAGWAAVTEPSSGIAQAALAPLRATRLRFIPSLSATSAGKVPSCAVAKRPALMLSPRATYAFPCSPSLSVPACTPITSLGAIDGPLAAGCPMARTNSRAQTRYVTTLGVRVRTAADPILLRPLCQPYPCWCSRDDRSPRLTESRLQGGDHLSQGADGPVWTVGHAEKLQSGLGEMLGGLAAAGGLRTGLGDDGARCLHFGGGEPGSGQQGAQHAAVPGRSAFERDQRRQRLLSILEVAADRLARLRAGAPDAEHVVDHLECDAEVVAELAGLFERRVAHAGRQAPEPCGALEEGGRLEADHFQVLIDRHVDALFE